MSYISDPRVADWPLMHAFHPTWLLTFLYLFIVWVGPKLMANRPALVLRYPVFIYNMGMVALNFHICSEVRLTTYSYLIVLLLE